MKAQNNWYGPDQISSLIKSYAPNVTPLMPVSALLGLTKQLGQIQQNGQYFIPLNINCLSQNFEEGKNNHWAGLYIKKDTYQTSVLYLDPMGKPMNSKLESQIKDKLTTDSIGQPLLNSPIQYIKDKGIELSGNIDDCGPILVYCIVSLANSKNMRHSIKSLEQSISFGQFLRESFDKNVGFEEIYQTLKASQESAPVIKKVSSSKVTSSSDTEDVDLFVSGILKAVEVGGSFADQAIGKVRKMAELGLPSKAVKIVNKSVEKSKTGSVAPIIDTTEIGKAALANNLIDTPPPSFERIMEAIKAGDPDYAKQLINKIDNNSLGELSRTDITGEPLLHMAISAGYKGVISSLLGKQPSLIDTVDAGGKTVLHIVAQKGDNKICKLLQIPKMKFETINAISNDGSTALHLAAVKDMREMCTLILPKMSFEVVAAINKDGNTAQQLAKVTGNQELANLILLEVIIKKAEEGNKLIGSDEAILAIGKTGAGKSALVNYLTNPENLEVVRHKDVRNPFDKGSLVIDLKPSVKFSSPNAPKIGHKKDSETAIPSAWRSTDGRVTYWDCPGFNDTNGPVQDIPNAFYLRRIFDIAARVKLMLVIDKGDLGTRANNIKELADTLGRLFAQNDLTSIMEGLSLVATKTDREVSIDDIKGEIVKMLQANCFKEYSKSKEMLMSLLLPGVNEKVFEDLTSSYFPTEPEVKPRLEPFLRLQNKIALFKKPVQEGALTEGFNMELLGDNQPILQTIENTKFIDKPKVNIAVSNESKVFITEVTEIVVQAAKGCLKDFSSTVGKSYRLKSSELKGNKQLDYLKTLQDKLVFSLTEVIGSCINNIEENIEAFTKMLALEFPKKQFSIQFSVDMLFNYLRYLKFSKCVKDDIDLNPTHWMEWLVTVRDEVLRYTYLPKPEIKNEAITGIVQIKGKTITSDDIKTGINDDCLSQLEAVEVYAQKVILSSNFEHSKLKGINFSIIAKQWEITKNITIDVSGVAGASHDPSKAANGDDITDTNPDGSGKRGNKGANGLPGLPGGPGGNFFGAGEEFFGIEKLTINVSGGRGGKGQDSGDGSNGTDATANGSKELLQQRTPMTLIEMRHIGQDEPKFLEVHRSKEKKVGKGGIEEGEVSKGGIGGDAGEAGIGGIGGRAGEVFLIGTKGGIYLDSQGEQGTHGIAGNSGKGGYSGIIYTGQYVNTKFSGEHTKDFFVGTGKLIKGASLLAPMAVKGTIEIGESAIVDFQDDNLTVTEGLKATGKLLYSAIATPLYAIVTPFVVPFYAVTSTVLASVGVIIGTPIALARDMYDIYINSGWQGKIQKSRTQSETGKVPSELNIKSIQSPKSSYEKFKPWLADNHFLEVYQEYLRLLESSHNGLVDKIRSSLTDFSFVPKTVVQGSYEEDSESDISSISYGTEERLEVAAVVDVPSNSKLNAFNQRHNPEYYYQINDIKMIQRYIQEEHRNKVLILDPCDKHQSVDRLIALSMSADHNIPVLCLLNHRGPDSLPHWVVMAVVNKNGKLVILYDNNIIEEAIKAKAQEETVEASKTDYIFMHFNHSIHQQSALVDSAVVALENMRVMAHELATDWNNFISHFTEYSGLFNLDKVPRLREEDFAKQLVHEVYRSIIIQKKQKQIFVKLKEKHQQELDHISQKLEELNIEGLRIKILGYDDILDRGNQKLKTSEGEFDISQAIYVGTAIEKIKSGKIYSYCYKMLWTIDLDWGGNIKFDQVKELFKGQKFTLEEDASNKIIKITPKINEAPYPVIPMPQVSPSELYRALCIEEDKDLQKEASHISNEYLHSLAKQQLSLFGSTRENTLIQALIKKNVMIKDTNLLLSKKANEPIIEWINQANKRNTDFENKILEVIAAMVRDAEMELISYVQDMLDKLFLMNLAYHDFMGDSLPKEWLHNFADLSLIGQDGEQLGYSV
jgi:ankyrin repeat protein